MKNIFIVLVTGFIVVTLSNCKKKEEFKSPYPDLEVTELQGSGQRSVGLDLISFPDGGVQAKTLIVKDKIPN